MPKTLMIKRDRGATDSRQMAPGDAQRCTAAANVVKLYSSDGIGSLEAIRRTDDVANAVSCIKSVRFVLGETNAPLALDHTTLKTNDTTDLDNSPKSVLRHRDNIPKPIRSDSLSQMNSDFVKNLNGSVLESGRQDFFSLVDVDKKDVISASIKGRKMISPGGHCTFFSSNDPLTRSAGQLERGAPCLRQEQDAPLELVKDKPSCTSTVTQVITFSAGTVKINNSDMYSRNAYKQVPPLATSPRNRNVLTVQNTKSEPVHIGHSTTHKLDPWFVDDSSDNKENIPAQFRCASQRRMTPKKKLGSGVLIRQTNVKTEFHGGLQEEYPRIKKVLFSPYSSPACDLGPNAELGLKPSSFGRSYKAPVENQPRKCTIKDLEEPKISSLTMSTSHFTAPDSHLPFDALRPDVHVMPDGGDHFQHSSHLGMDNKLPERWSSTESKAAIKPERDNSDYYSYDADHNRASLSPPNKSEVGSSTDDESHYHPHLDIPPPTVQVDVVGLGSDEEEAYVDGNTGNRHVEYRGAEDSGVVLDLSRSLDVAASSPCREQCWTKPQFTSTPLWRPWSQFRKAENEDTGVQESPLIQSLSSEDQGLHFNSQQTLSKNIEAPLDLRVNQPIPTQIAANNYSYVLSPMPYALQHPALALNYPQIQLASTLPATENSQSSLPSHYQCQVPQVTTTCSTKGKGKRPSSTTCMQVSAKQARCNSSPKSPTRAPLTEFPQKLIRQTRNIHGVMLAMPPENALPSRAALKGKRKCTKEDDQGTSSKCSENSRKRDRPQPYGDHELHEFVVQFYDSPLRSKYCDENNKYQVPRVPDNREDQAILRSELLELFQHSNLPGVPSALQYNVHALCFYPKMQHLFSLHQDGVDLEVLHFGAYGQAFGNLNLAAMSDDELNTILDSMSYVGDDGLMHCLVIRTVDNGVVCDHVATELGKMRRHSKNHYPEKKWVCCFCRAQMPDMTDMERHTSTHTGLKPFRCIECNKFFAQKITLGHHLKSVHNLVMTKMDPKKTFTCRQDGCLFQEHEREACLLHLEQHHSQEDFRNRKKRKQWPYDL
ncbi:uncharacterized protein LOC106067337 [Biomphalaria glabrata]|uniref:Uncharacterized protein LOC106067337 n=1 Tax=Biomphalaria glabrata TaxID=6526 RepID=A0A9W3B143_BIOGL|nr:uncharacterized protein LOC106067337 [Biomphalaria glabrata]